MRSLFVVESTGGVTNALASAADALASRGGPHYCVSNVDVGEASGRADNDTRMVLLVQEELDGASFSSQVSSVAGDIRDSVAVVAVPSPNLTYLEGDWLPGYFGVDVMLWALRGARAVVTADNLGSPAILRRLGDLTPELRGRAAVVVGRDPLQRLDVLDTEMRDIWFDMQDEMVSWRTAFALSYAAPLPADQNEWQLIAGYLTGAAPWFSYNTEDVRKALGRLQAAWRCEGGRFKHRIGTVALKRGYSRNLSDPARDVDELFGFAKDIDVSGRTRQSGGGHDWEELILRSD